MRMAFPSMLVCVFGVVVGDACLVVIPCTRSSFKRHYTSARGVPHVLCGMSMCIFGAALCRDG